MIYLPTPDDGYSIDKSASIISPAPAATGLPLAGAVVPAAAASSSINFAGTSAVFLHFG